MDEHQGENPYEPPRLPRGSVGSTPTAPAGPYGTTRRPRGPPTPPWHRSKVKVAVAGTLALAVGLGGVAIGERSATTP